MIRLKMEAEGARCKCVGQGGVGRGTKWEMHRVNGVGARFELKVEYSSFENEFTAEREKDGVFFLYGDNEVNLIFFKEDSNNFDNAPKFDGDGHDFVENKLVFRDNGFVIEVISHPNCPENDFMRYFREDLHRRLLSLDFKKQVEGLELLQKALPSSDKEIIELLDILLRWFVLRFWLVDAKLQRRRQEPTQTTPDQPVDDEAVYYKVAGECPKGRVNGLGSLGRKKRRYADADASTSQNNENCGFFVDTLVS
ncbi:hypothetical protein Scep_014378 [Stephania cephalantha]|uniref:Uncharacterized protein n=1 Tax=Stephania cephalantha TaxID=152367 RepID=A0AAP0J0V1_9MAGN